MSKMIIMRGLPASGKSTWARKWVAEDVANRARLNRDDLRAMLHNSVWKGHPTESQIVTVETTSAQMLLESGKDVVIDDTNLPNRTVKMFMAIARDAKAEVEIKDFTDVDIEECIRRDGSRYDGANQLAMVGEDVIRDMHRRFLKGKPYPLPVPELNEEALPGVEPYVGNPDLPTAILVDMDGTLAKLNGRSPYDETKVLQDSPNWPVVEAVEAAYVQDCEIIVMSGRTEGCRADTEEWLEAVVPVPIVGPFMRAEGDQRPDSVVKSELFDEHVRGKYNVRYVLDDRDQVVKLWRSMGIACFQVDYGKF